MSDTKDDLEDIISTLNSIRDELMGNLQGPSSEAKDEQPTQEQGEGYASRALEEYLENRLHQMDEIVTEKQEITGAKIGNGWDSTQVNEHVYKIEPIPVRRALAVSQSSSRTFKERLASIFSGRNEEFRLVGTPLVEYLPIWKVKGFHECFYLRSNTYTVNVKDDVVAVEVEGQSRDLVLERKQRGFIPSVIVQRFERLGSLLSNESKYFTLTDVTELVSKRYDAELTITGEGKALTADEEVAVTSGKLTRIFDLKELKIKGAKAQARNCSVSKSAVLDKFRSKLVRMPEQFKKILSNRLQVTELTLTYVPFIRITIQKGLIPREIVVNGITGELADKNLLTLLA